MAVVWTIDCADAGGDFAFIFNPSLSYLHQITFDVEGPPIEVDFDAAQFTEWIRMRITDVIVEENQQDSVHPELRKGRALASPVDFAFDNRSKTLLLMQKNGLVCERSCDMDKSGWARVAHVNMRDDDVEDATLGSNNSILLATLKRGRFLSLILGNELHVFDLNDEGHALHCTNPKQDKELVKEKGSLGFCRGQMPLPLLSQSGVGISRVAIVPLNKPKEDVASKGFGKILSQVDDLVSRKDVDKPKLLEDIIQFSDKSRPNAFLRSVRPELEMLAQTLCSFVEWRERSCSVPPVGEEDSSQPLSMSDRLVGELYRLAAEKLLEDEARISLMHQLEFLSHSDPQQVLTALTSLVYCDVSEEEKSNVDSALKTVFFSTSTISTFSSPVSSPTTPTQTKSPESLNSCVLQLFASLTLLHRPADFPALMKDFFSRFCGDDGGQDWIKASRVLEELQKRLDEEGHFKAAKSLNAFLKDVNVKRASGDEKSGSHDSLSTMKSLLKRADWDACLVLLSAQKATSHALTYKTLFSVFLDGIRSRLKDVKSRFLGDALRLMPDGYDVERILTLIEQVDDSPCSSKLICRNPDCTHVTVKDMPVN